MKDKIKVAVIDNSMDSYIYNPIRHWKAWCPFELEAFKATQSRFPDLKKGYTHLILTGFEASILERETWDDKEIEMLLFS